jgi:acyl-CoA synthetase (AMP-forming)/AMP-acid ligase II
MKRSTARLNWGQSVATLVDRFATLPAVCTPDGSHDFQEVMGRAAAVGLALRCHGIQHGQPVATVLPNAAHAVWASYGVMLSGAAETALNASLSVDELNYCLGLLDIRHVIADEHTAAAVRATGREPLRIEELDSITATVDRRSPVAGDLWGKILFTSGTTGRPNAIVHSHAGRWLANLMLRSSLPFQPGPGTRILLMTPYSHGASLLAAAFLDSGASIYLMNGVQPDRIRDLIGSGEVDCMFAPPTVLAKLTSSLDGFSSRSLRTIFSGTSTLTGSLYGKVRDMFGPVVRITYGKTEIFNPITVLPPSECDAAFALGHEGGANLGWPASGVEIDIRDENGAPCDAGESGRIFLRAPHLMAGYVNANGFQEVAADEWHESGDVGHISPRGELILSGRDREMIKTGGFKIFPHEVESPFDSAEFDHMVIAVGIPSEYWGQIVVLVAEGAPPGWEIKAQQAAEVLSRHKRPRAYVSVPELPRNAQGKLQRSKIVDMLLTRYRVEDGPHPKLNPLSDPS